MQTRPFVLVGESTLALSRQRAAAALAGWREAWGYGREDVQVTCARAADASARDAFGWRAWRHAQAAFAWVRFEDDFAARLQAGLFESASPAAEGPARGDSLAAEVANAAAGDLMASLLAALRGKPAVAVEPLESDTLPAHLFLPGSGALQVRIALQGAILHLMLPHGQIPAATSSAKDRPALSGLPAALREMSVTVAAEIGAIELELGALQALAPGDVVRLGTRLDVPVGVFGPDGERLCHGHLGAHEGSRALDLIP